MTNKSFAIALLLTLAATATLLSIEPATATPCQAFGQGYGIDGYDDLEWPEAVPSARCAYTFTGTGIVFADSMQSVSPSTSVKLVDGADATYQLPSEPICVIAGCGGTTTYSVAVRMDDLPAGGQLELLRTGNGANTWRTIIGADGALSGYFIGSDGTASSAGSIAMLAVDTWYTVEVAISIDVDNDGAGADTNDPDTMGIRIMQAGAVIAGTAITGEQISSGANSDLFTMIMTTATTEYWLDDLMFPAPGLSSVPSIGAASATTVDDLIGFDVSSGGETLIARTNNGDTVEVYNAGSLSSPATTDTDCTTVGGIADSEWNVAAMRSHVIYLDCEAGGDANEIRIRSPSLNSPTQPPVCTDGDFCVTDLDTTCGITGMDCIVGDQGDDTQLAIIEEFPIDYSKYYTNGLNHVFIAMAFADTDGDIGVWTYAANNNDWDQSNIAEVGMTTGQAPNMICAHQDRDTGRTYLYGSSTESNVRGYYVSFTVDGGTLDTFNLIPAMTEVFSSVESNVKGVGCGEDRIAVLTSTGFTVWPHNDIGHSSAPGCTVTGLSSVPTRGIDMTSNGLWISVVAGSNWYVYNATTPAGQTCQLVGQGSIPTPGDFRAIQTMGCGGSVWVGTGGTDGKIERYDVDGVTVGRSCIYNTVLNPNDIDGDGVPNAADPDIDGDGLCNGNGAIPAQLLGTPGALNGCTPGDTDDDDDSIPNTQDTTPGGSGGGADATPSDDDFSTGGQATIVILATVIGLFLGGLFSRWNHVVAGSTGMALQVLATIIWANDMWIVPTLCGLAAAALLAFHRKGG